MGGGGTLSRRHDESATTMTMPAVGYSGDSTVKRTATTTNNTSYAYAGFNEGGVLPGETQPQQQQQQQQPNYSATTASTGPVTIKLTISNGTAQAASVVTTNAGSNGANVALSTVGSGGGVGGGGGGNLSYSSSGIY